MPKEKETPRTDFITWSPGSFSFQLRVMLHAAIGRKGFGQGSRSGGVYRLGSVVVALGDRLAPRQTAIIVVIALLPGGDGHPTTILILLQVRLDRAFCDKGLIPCHRAECACISTGDGNAGCSAADVCKCVGLQECRTEHKEQQGAQDGRNESLGFLWHKKSLRFSILGCWYPILETEVFCDRKSSFFI